MACAPAAACKAVLAQANGVAPNRNKASDGICASPKHTQQNPTSDHETGDAVDLTHDPANGCDVEYLLNLVVQRRDGRVKYIIWRRRILRSYTKDGIPAWTWAAYSGSNPHDKHCHISIHKAARNDTAPWFVIGDEPAQEEDDMTGDQAQMLTDNHNRIKNAEDALQAIQKTLAEIIGRLDTQPAGNTGNASLVGKYTIEVSQ